MTSDGARHRAMLDAKDDMIILDELQVASLIDKLDTLRREKQQIDTAIESIEARLHASGEARLRKQRRNQV